MNEHAARRTVRERAAGLCEVRVMDVCTGGGQDWQHRKNRSQGGRWEPSNGLLVCRACHHHIHTNPAEAMRCGWTVSASADPATTPALIHTVTLGHDWIVLDDAGFVFRAPWPSSAAGMPDDLPAVAALAAARPERTAS
ncbi:HNH endonuclease [Crossiella sp. SN42]|uniref:HNH endonuclease n=1 Tax=Crossiella sp. SN42 TaxID=2944808 RepID=UPI00207D2F51|nr:HNH endonuclease signature motif containing protein [Crossiella sp. SN42]MCO1575002.1 HNH endonuclease [Crossiella sp. SN42]